MSDFLDEIVDLSLVGDVGADRHRAPTQVGDLLGDVLEALDRPGRQHQIGAGLGTSPRERGAQRRTDTTDHDYFAIKHSSHVLPHHPVGDLLLTQRNPGSPVLFGDLVRLVVRQRGRHLVKLHEFHGGTVGLGELA